MKVVFGVQWIEIEFGQRLEGWSLFTNAEECVERTKEASAKGPYPGGYIGPERPLRMYEIPFDSLDKETQKDLKKKGTAHTANNWQPKFKDSGTSIR